jgi:DNA-binding CsgD family transcriptional regulator
MDGVNVDARNFKMGADYHEKPALASAIVDCYRNVVCGTLAEHVPDPEQLRTMREDYARVGLQDQLLINGANPSGLGCALYVFSKTRLRLSALERELMTRLAAHLSTAYRLQRRLEKTLTAQEGLVEAVLKVDGRLEHAEPTASSPEARRSLTGAVKLREWARAPAGRSNPESATAAWKPLVHGRWSLVDRYEHNGTRYITARENAPVPAGPSAFSPREQQVASLAGLGRSNKLIAYELGLAHSTVRVLLARAAAKMGARTRSEMIEQLRTRG